MDSENKQSQSLFMAMAEKLDIPLEQRQSRLKELLTEVRGLMVEEKAVNTINEFSLSENDINKSRKHLTEIQENLTRLRMEAFLIRQTLTVEEDNATWEGVE